MYACQLCAIIKYSLKLQSPYFGARPEGPRALLILTTQSLIGPCGHSWPACQIIACLSEEIQMTICHGLVVIRAEVVLTKGVQVISFAASALINGCYMISKDISFLMKQMHFDGNAVMNRLAGFLWCHLFSLNDILNQYKAYTVFTGKNKHCRRDFWGLRERERVVTPKSMALSSL